MPCPVGTTFSMNRFDRALFCSTSTRDGPWPCKTLIQSLCAFGWALPDTAFLRISKKIVSHRSVQSSQLQPERECCHAKGGGNHDHTATWSPFPKKIIRNLHRLERAFTSIKRISPTNHSNFIFRQFIVTPVNIRVTRWNMIAYSVNGDFD